MEQQVEVHADDESIGALRAEARIIGVNNRNLDTFQLDLETSERADRHE
jgi:indole-3-glycerol phosphate synthase